MRKDQSWLISKPIFIILKEKWGNEWARTGKRKGDFDSFLLSFFFSSSSLSLSSIFLLLYLHLLFFFFFISRLQLAWTSFIGLSQMFHDIDIIKPEKLLRQKTLSFCPSVFVDFFFVPFSFLSFFSCFKDVSRRFFFGWPQGKFILFPFETILGPSKLLSDSSIRSWSQSALPF